VSLCNVANVLTISRILLVPLFLVALFADHGGSVGWRLVATGIFALASLTDRVDGDLARNKGLVTDFGKIADPIADKALTGAALFGLSALGVLWWWATIVIAVRELGVTLLRFSVLRHGVLPASRGGKAKAFAQAVAIGLYLLPLPVVLAPLRDSVLGIAILLTVATGVDYVLRALRLRAASTRSPWADGHRDGLRGDGPGRYRERRTSPREARDDDPAPRGDR
jgi:CDP-diacylglycerol--glycerol-3-phosphate 3-phosphatidyltransferase